MKILFSKHIVFLMICLLGLNIFNLKAQNQQEDDEFAKLWIKADAFLDQGLPKSALPEVEAIQQKALKSNHQPQYIKCLIYKIKLINLTEEDADVKAIDLIRNEIGRSQPPSTQILHSLLAELYWTYYEAHRYTLLERTELADGGGEDLKTWTLGRLEKEVMFHARASLSQALFLQGILLKNFDLLLEKAEQSKEYRPTLYDFLAHRVLDHLMNDEARVAEATQPFQIDNPAYLQPSQEFTRFKISSQDTNAGNYLALRIFQDLESFHLKVSEPKALIDVMLERMDFVKDKGIILQKDSVYTKALWALEKFYNNFPAGTQITYKLAGWLHETGSKYMPLKSSKYKWDHHVADSLCSAAIRRFPASDGAVNCQRLQFDLRQGALGFQIAYGNVPDKPIAGLLKYKNVKEVFYRIIKISPEKDKLIREQENKNDQVVAYLAEPVVYSSSFQVPDDGDLQQHSVQFDLPAMKQGYYVVVMSSGKDFSVVTDVLAVTNFWVTRISYVQRQHEDGGYEIYILDRNDGKPMKNITMTAYSFEYDYKRRKRETKLWQTFTSDKNGYIRITGAPNREASRSLYMVFSGKDDQFVSESYFYVGYTGAPERPLRPRTYFFTDRAIYRPGQTLFFKGIVIEGKGDQYSIKPNMKSTVVLSDANGKKVGSLEVITNGFGSFSGQFTLPTGTMNGYMRISNETGNAGIRVEEYKRPKFEVKFEPVTGTYKLGEVITMKGVARTYSGNAADGARVTYKVVRNASFPYWFGYRGFLPETEKTQITTGQTSTAGDGSFSITFRASADPAVTPKDQAVFYFEVSADVTDINGETHQASQEIAVSYQALQLSVDLPDQVNLLEKRNYLVKTTNLAGRKEAATVKVDIFPLKSPGKVYRKARWDRPDRFIMTKEEFSAKFPADIYDQEDDYTTWPREAAVFSTTLQTASDSLFLLKNISSWKPGRYVMELHSSDTYGSPVNLTRYFTAYSPKSSDIPVNETLWLTVDKMRAEPGEKITVLTGTKAGKVHLVYEISCKNKILQRKWMDINNEQIKIEIPVTEENRGNIGVAVYGVKDNQSYEASEIITVPYTNKELDLQISTFRDKALPGEREEYKVTIRGRTGDKVASELMAGMYDASLETFARHSWSLNLYAGNYNVPRWYDQESFSVQDNINVFTPDPAGLPDLRYHGYDGLNWFGYYPAPPPPIRGARAVYRNNRFDGAYGPAPQLSAKMVEVTDVNANTIRADHTEADVSASQQSNGLAGLSAVKFRSDYRETAFFFPEMKTDTAGNLVLRFSLPQSLTRWKLMGLAHTKDLRVGTLEKELVTQKDLMIFPNMPRFFREGDTLHLQTKISVLEGKTLAGTAELQLFDGISQQELPAANLLSAKKKDFSCSNGQSTVVDWTVAIPRGIYAIRYKVSATAGNFTDGEEALVPVLTQRVLVTEALPLPVSQKGTSTFSFDKLMGSGNSKTITNFKLSLEFTSNPAWYAVQALPFIMEDNRETADQVFNRLYANSLGTYVMMTSAQMMHVVEAWRSLSPSALQSNLSKNQDLKEVMLEETPWVMEAKQESDQKNRVGNLYDFNEMDMQMQRAIDKLARFQTPNGGWPWFEGMPDNRFITQYIVSGLARMERIGIKRVRSDQDAFTMVSKAVQYLDDRALEDYLILKKNYPATMADDHLSPIIIQYLYIRSHYMEDLVLGHQMKEAFDYFIDQTKKYWVKENPYMQAMIAVSLKRFGNEVTPKDILRSLRERAIHSTEMGMYWKEVKSSWYWHQAPVQSQVQIIEAFDEILNDRQAVDEMRIWLLKQKQTHDWKSTAATADACYALLMRGSDLLKSSALPEFTLGGQKMDPRTRPDTRVEAGSGYFKTSWSEAAIRPDQGKITVTHNNDGIAWGAMYWQYFEDMDKVTAAQTPLSLQKKIFVERNGPQGKVLEAISPANPVKTGDKLVVRLEIRTDRDMEFVQLKDHRAAGMEPMDVLSGYKTQNGLDYYETTQDATTNFFFPYLAKGTYVFEYALTANIKGEYSAGFARITCLYAPEFTAHSEGTRIKID